MKPAITRLSNATLTAMRLAMTLARSGARFQFGVAMIVCNDGTKQLTRKPQ
jgi:hypothetical protein